jgi:hypothetical protein
MTKEKMPSSLVSGEETAKEAVESKEKEPKPFFLIYRDNDLFKEYIPVIASILQEEGRLVKVQSFPAGTPEEDINRWYLEHGAEVNSSRILADYTTKRSTNYELKSEINLDDLMAGATAEAIFGADGGFGKRYKRLRRDAKEGLDKKEDYLSFLGEMYKNILLAVPEEKRQKMSIVILRGLLKSFPPLIEHEPFCPEDREADFEKMSQETNEFADKMQKWFEDAGIPKVDIY